MVVGMVPSVVVNKVSKSNQTTDARARSPQVLLLIRITASLPHPTISTNERTSIATQAFARSALLPALSAGYKKKLLVLHHFNTENESSGGLAFDIQ
jgi:hypothetical protein